MRIPLRRTIGPSISGKIHKLWMKEANRGYTPEEVKKWYPAPNTTDLDAAETSMVKANHEQALMNTLPVRAKDRTLDKRTPVQALGKAE